jgi:hypothetical protein
VTATLGAEWFPLRDNLEHDILQAAAGSDGKGEYPGDSVDAAQKASDFRTQPGLYLRMRLADAATPSTIRTAAADSRRDGFAACLLRETNERGLKGEINGGAFAEQPWNLGQAYAATRILTDEWVDEVKNLDEDLRLRAFNQQYSKAIRDEIPLAIDIVKRAQFFLLVLDEDVPEAAKYTDGGGLTEAALQMVPHPARVYVFQVKDNKPLVRLRRSGGGTFIQAGERAITDDETHDALQRQANNCSLAQVVDADLKASK